MQINAGTFFFSIVDKKSTNCRFEKYKNKIFKNVVNKIYHYVQEILKNILVP